MSESNLLRKDQLEGNLFKEQKLIRDGILKEDNPLDVSESFRDLCDACRRGDLKVCQEKITEGVNINGRDQFDYTPLILASLCGHYEVVQLLIDAGALCERDTFQGERCLYNALNDRIRNLLLQYDYSKSSDPLQPFAAHVASLLVRDHPQTSDIVVEAEEDRFPLHKFILSARSPYFYRKLAQTPDTASWKLPGSIPPQAFSAAIKYLYLGEAPHELKAGPGTGFTEGEVLTGIDKIARQLEIQSLFDSIIDGGDRRLARQRRSDEVSKGRSQMESWFRDNVLKHKTVVDTDKVNDVKWDRHNGIFADVLLCADDPTADDPEEEEDAGIQEGERQSHIPVGPGSEKGGSVSHAHRHRRKSVLFPAHRAMLLRSEFFLTMFSSSFREAQVDEHLHVIPIACTPEVLEVVLTFLYTEKADFALDVAVDVLFAADLLMIEKLKTKAAVVISTLGNGNMSQAQASRPRADGTEEAEAAVIDIYEIMHAAWLTRVQRLEEFAARYLAYRLEDHIDLPDFAELIAESATRIEKRQETDSIELLDDIRYYLGERFRLRFEDSGLDVMEADGSADETAPAPPPEDEGVDVHADAELGQKAADVEHVPVIRTLDGEIAGDEFDIDARNYQILLNKLDQLLETLNLDA